MSIPNIFKHSAVVEILAFTFVFVLAGSMLHRYVGGPSLYDGSVANYYSPMESPEQSDDEEGKDDMAYPAGGVRIPKHYRKKINYSERVSIYCAFYYFNKMLAADERLELDK